MKKYIFITNEGTTFSPNGIEIENMQVIGTVEDAGNGYGIHTRSGYGYGLGGFARAPFVASLVGRCA